MVYIKVLDPEGAVVRAEALEYPGYVKYDTIHSMLLRCAAADATGILSADSSAAYNLGSTGIGADYSAEIIDFAEYDSIRIHETDPEDTEPEIPDDPDGDGKNPMTRAELTEEVAALKKANAMLIGMLLENREDSMRASKTYSEGDLIIVDGTLYKVQSRIASGAALTVGTNVKQTTLAAEIAAANS